MSPFVVAEDVFRQQLEYLVRSQTAVLTADELADGRSTAERAVLLTFDDGYLDNYTVAFPILCELGLRASFFVITNFAGRHNTWDARSPTGRTPLMGTRHLRELVRHGMLVGSHGVTHRSLRALSDRDVRRELTESKDVLEQSLGVPVRHFAYPYGAVDERVKKVVRASAYDSAFAVHSGPLRSHVDPYEIRRVIVGNRADEWYLFAKRSGVDSLFRWSRWKRPKQS